MSNINNTNSPDGVKKNNQYEIEQYHKNSRNALKLVDDIVLKNYLTKLSNMDVVEPVSLNINRDNIILYKINKMVYEKDEYATDKFISVVSAMTYTNSSIFLIVDGNESKTDFYLGTNCNDLERTASSVADTFRSSILGQFPGVETKDLSKPNKDSIKEQSKLFDEINMAVCISSCVGVPSYKNSKGEYTNANFIQGIEKFATAMHGKRYTAIILANNSSKSEIANIRRGYENIYSELSAMATRQLAYSTNESLAYAYSRTKGHTNTVTESDTTGISITDGNSSTHTEGSSTTITKTEGTSEDNGWGKLAKLSGPIMQAGALLTATGVGAPIGAVMMGVGAAASIGGALGAKQVSKSESEANGSNESDSKTENHSETKNESHTDSSSRAENFSETDGTTSTVGSSKNFTITIQDKHILEIQKKIDKQLERIELCESTGLWSTGAYFMSYGTDRAVAEICATVFRSIMQGEQSGVEMSAINTWYPESQTNFKNLISYISNCYHPIFEYKNSAIDTHIFLTPTSLLSSKELAMLIGLPRKSVPGFPVVEHVSLAKEVVSLNEHTDRTKLNLGCIFDQGIEMKDNTVCLDVKSFTQHTFVTGSTGCGKSNTIYHLIKQIRNQSNV